MNTSMGIYSDDIINPYTKASILKKEPNICKKINGVDITLCANGINKSSELRKIILSFIGIIFITSLFAFTIQINFGLPDPEGLPVIAFPFECFTPIAFAIGIIIGNYIKSKRKN